MNNSIETPTPLTINSIKEIYQQYDFFIFDMDGVLWQGENIIESGKQAVLFLMENDKQVIFYTNNSTRSRLTYVEKLHSCGIEADQARVYSSSSVAANYAKNVLNTKKAYVVGMQGIIDELGLFNIDSFSDHEDENVMTYEMFRTLKIPDDIDTVVVGYDQNFNYYKMCYASLCIQKGARFLASNPDSNVLVGQYKMPAGGCMVAAIAKSQNVKPIYVGKPEILGFQIMSQEHKITDKTRVVMIGDNLETDIAFGLNSGIDTIVVLTGVTNRDEAIKCQAKYIAESLF